MEKFKVNSVDHYSLHTFRFGSETPAFFQKGKEIKGNARVVDRIIGS